MDKHVIGLMPGVPVPRIVSVCDGNGEAWFEVQVGKNQFVAHAPSVWHYDVSGYRWPYRTRPEALDAVRAYIEHTSAEQHYVLAEETIDCVPEAV